MRRIVSASLSLVLLFALLVRPLAAATDHVGRVTLTGGTPVPGARVTATQGGTTQTTTTDVQGAYRLPALADGTWTIEVAMVGFSPQRRDVTVGGTGSAPSTWELAVMPFAEITRGITVPPAAPPIDRRAAAQRTQGRAAGAGTASADAFQRAGVAPGGANPAAGRGLPLPAGVNPAAGRGLPLPAGVNPAAAGRGAPPPLAPLPASLSEAGGDAFLVSGSVNTGQAQPSVGNQARPTGLRLFRGQVTVQGANSAWDARPFSLTGLPSTKPDTSSLNVSSIFQAPIRLPWLGMRTNKNLLLQFNRNVTNNANLQAALMPTLLQRAGDFSQTVDGFGNAVQLRDPVTGIPFAGNQIPLDRISPQAATLLALYPQPQLGTTGRYNYQIPAFSSNVNHSFNANIGNLISNTTNQMGVQGGYNRSSSDSTSLFGFDDNSHGSGMTVGVNWSRRFVPSNLQFQLRHTYNRNTNTSEPFFANNINVSGIAGITGNNQEPQNWGPPGLSFASELAGLSSGQYSLNRTQSHAFNFTMPYTKGRHTLIVGSDVRYQANDSVSQQNARGSFTFNGSFSGHDLADFMLGLPNTSAIAYGNADKGFRSWNYSMSVNDDFRTTQSVTLNVGIRWDFEVPVEERNDRLVNLDVADDFSAAAPVIATDGIGPITGRHYPSSLIKSSPWGFQPRFGVAWRPIPTSSVILRAGYGIYRNTNIYQALAQQMSQQPPLSYAFNSVSTPSTPLTLANGFIAPVALTLNTVAFDPDFKVGTVHRWQASAQRDLPGGFTAVATYLAGKGINLPQSFIPNTFPQGATNPCPACPTGFVYTTSGGRSLQNAGQFELRKRLQSGLQWTTTYTLTKATDNASSFTGPGGAIAQNWLDLDAEYGSSSFEQRHQFRFNVSYNTGQGVGGGALRSGWKGKILNGWSTNANLTAGSGTPRSPIYRVTSVAGVTGTVRANLTGEAIDGGPDGYYANPDAFEPPTPGEWGNAPRNSIRGPSQFSFNANASRNFQLRNRFSLNWQIIATNLLNRVTYSAINTTVGSPQFGLPTAPGGNRRISTRVNFGF
jgi:hypothetical protein